MFHKQCLLNQLLIETVSTEPRRKDVLLMKHVSFPNNKVG